MEKLKERPRAHAAAWAGLTLAILLVLLPTGYTLLISFKEYSITEGAASPWVGFANYRMFFALGERAHLIGNSVLLSVLGFAGALVLGVLAGWLVPHLRGRGLRLAALAALLLPVFVPTVCWAGCVPGMLGGNVHASRWLYVLIAAIRGAGIIGFSGVSFAIADPGRGFWKGVGWASFLWAFLSLTPDFELVYLMESPLSYAAMDVLDTYAFRAGLMQFNMGTSAAAFVVKALLQMVIGAVVGIGVYFIFLRGRREPLDSFLREETEVAPVVWAVPVGLFTLAGVLLFGLHLPLGGEEALLLNTLPPQLIIAVLAGGVAFLLAWAVIVSLRACKAVVFCAVSGLLLTLQGPWTGAFTLMRQLGLFNTLVPVIILALFTPTGMLLTLVCARLSQAPRMAGRPAWLLALLPACYAMANVWGGLAAPLSFVARQDISPWGLRLFYTMQQSGQMGTLSYLGVLAVPLLLGGLGAWALWRYLRGGGTSFS